MERPSAKHPWYFEETRGAVRVGSSGERFLPRQRGTHDVVAQRSGIAGVRRRFDAVGGDALNLFRLGENSGELAREEIFFLRRQFEPCQARNAFDVRARKYV